MSEQSKTTVRIWLPVIVPMAVNLIGSAWVLVAAKGARYTGACGIDLPWDRETSYAILARFFSAALEEVETFKAVVSPCIADLHADITAAYIISVLTAVVFSFLTIKFTMYPRIDLYNEQKDKYVKGAFAAFSIMLICLSLYYVLTMVSGFIDFTGHVRRMIHVRDGYVSLLRYWFEAQGLGFTLTMALWCFYYGVNVLNSLLRHK